MPIYEITDEKTGITLELEGDSPPTNQELEMIFEDVRSKMQPAPMTDEQLRERMTVQQPQRQQPVISEPPGFRQNQQVWEQTGKSTPIGQISEGMGSAALGILQGSTGGISKAAFKANRARGQYNPYEASEEGLKEYERASESNAPAYTIGELAGGIWTGNQLGKAAMGARPVRQAIAGTRALPGKVARPVRAAAKFATRSTAEAAPWISQAGIEGGVGEASKEAGINLAVDAALGWVGKGVLKGVRKILPTTTRVSKEALETFSSPEGRKMIQEFAGKGEELADYVIENLDNFDDFLPDYKRVETLLEKMPPIKKSTAINHIKDIMFDEAGNEIFEATTGTNLNKKIEKIVNIIEKNYPGDLLPASDYKKIIKDFDNGLYAAYGKQVDVFKTKLKVMRHNVNETLKQVAEKSGNKEYLDLMDEIHSKLQLKKSIEKKVGSAVDPYSRADRTERLLSSLTHKNKGGTRKLVDDLGEIFGDDVKGKAEAISYALQLGIDVNKKQPAWFNTIFLRSLLGGISGGASLGLLGGFAGTGGAAIPGAIAGIGVGAAATSPRVGSMLYKGFSPQTGRNIAKIRYTIGDVTKQGE